MRVVSIGDLVTDYYYKNGKLLGVNGGMTSHNIIANLANMKVDTAVFGACGNDKAGRIAVKSLEDIDVDTNNVIILDNIKTRCFHVSYFEDDKGLRFASKKRCPICNEKKWYNDSLIVPEDIIKKIDSTDILVFDNLNSTNQKIIDSVKNVKVIDLGQYFEFETLSNEEIVDKIKNKFAIINFNERVTNYLLDRFKLVDEKDLYDLFNIELMTITKGKNGARFILNGKVFDFKLDDVVEEVDSTGAGDAFCSSIINSYICDNMDIKEDRLEEWYRNSVKLTKKVVKCMGARGHINTLFRIKKCNQACTCNDFQVVTRKQIKRCNININNLRSRIVNALSSNAYKSLCNINFSEMENYLFVGTGGSFAGAKFASIVINEMFGSNTYAIWPRDVLYRNNKNINKIFMFSYSGTTNDIIESSKEFDSSDKYIITKGEHQKIVLKTGISKNNIISYRTGSNKGKERGFLSFEGAVAPAALFLKYYFKDKEFDIEEFIDNSMAYWNDFYKEKFKDKFIKDMFVVGNMLNIFTGDYTYCASIDIESKLTESGIINSIVHEKKNFSHGRFINYENLNNKNSIYFKQKTTDDYEKTLLKYLNNGNNIIIESRYDGILCEFDLLIASQLLIYYVGKLLDIDVSKPKYSEDAMKIYFYKGQL